MIIWSRFGLLSFFAIGAGALIGLPVMTAIGTVNSPVTGVLIFVLAAGFNALLAFVVYPRLDKAYPLTYTVPLPQPERLPNGQVRTHQVLPALDQNGQPLRRKPTSSLFFIPGRYWWMICLGIALVLAIVSLFV